MARVYLNKSLDRGLRILDLFDDSRAMLSASEIAALLGTTAATLYPTLHTLLRHGYLARDEQKRYQLSMKLLERSGHVLAQSDVRRVARPHLRDLARRHHVTADLAILYGSEVLYLEREVGHPAAVLGEVVGRRVPIHCTSLGKVMLAFMPESERSELLNSLSLAACTPYTITTRKQLLVELAAIRDRGYAMDIQEFHLGNACVGAPVWSHGGRVVAAISLMLPVDDRILRGSCDEEAAAVVETAQAISAELGFGRAPVPSVGGPRAERR
ncbi:MAG: IclR family transcriptional regulator [Candidatus Bipolaricaulota bacterium]